MNKKSTIADPERRPENHRHDPLDIPEFFNAACLFAVFLFALNNSYLKLAYHNVITGKLSDFSACFFLPLFISAILSLATKLNGIKRVKIGCLTTLIIFSAVKISPTLSQLLNASLSAITQSFGFGNSNNIADPNDLVALPMILLAYFYAKFKLRHNKSS